MNKLGVNWTSPGGDVLKIPLLVQTITDYVDYDNLGYWTETAPGIRRFVQTRIDQEIFTIDKLAELKELSNETQPHSYDNLFKWYTDIMIRSEVRAKDCFYTGTKLGLNFQKIRFKGYPAISIRPLAGIGQTLLSETVITKTTDQKEIIYEQIINIYLSQKIQVKFLGFKSGIPYLLIRGDE